MDKYIHIENKGNHHGKYANVENIKTELPRNSLLDQF